MNPPDDMLDAIYLGDDPDTAALVVADWYDEHDQAVRARLIRLCVRLTQMAVDDPMRYEVADERDRLLGLHGEMLFGPDQMQEWAPTDWDSPPVVDEWAQPTWAMAPTSFCLDEACERIDRQMAEYAYRRYRFYENRDDMGEIVGRAKSRLRGLMLMGIPPWFETLSEWLTLESLGLILTDSDLLGHPRILQSQAVSRLRVLWVFACFGSGLERMPWHQAVWVARLRSLTIIGNVEGLPDVPAFELFPLLDGTQFRSLQLLELESLRLIPTSEDWHLSLKPLPSIRRLRLRAIVGDSAEFVKLGHYLGRTGLVELEIQCASFRDDATYRAFVTGLARNTSLRSLRLDHHHYNSMEYAAWVNWLTTAGPMIDWPGFSRLRRLELLCLDVRQAGFTRLIEAIGGGNLEELSLDHSHVEPSPRSPSDVFRELANRLRPGQLRTFRLRGYFDHVIFASVDLTNVLIGLLNSSGMRRLRRLEIAGLIRSANCVQMISEHVELPELRSLECDMTNMNETDLGLLLNAPGLPRLWCVSTGLHDVSPFPGWRLLHSGILICPERMT